MVVELSTDVVDGEDGGFVGEIFLVEADEVSDEAEREHDAHDGGDGPDGVGGDDAAGAVKGGEIPFERGEREGEGALGLAGVIERERDMGGGRIGEGLECVFGALGIAAGGGGGEEVAVFYSGGCACAVVVAFDNEDFIRGIGETNFEAMFDDEARRPGLNGFAAHEDFEDGEHGREAAGEGEADEEGAGDGDNDQAAMGDEIAERPPEVGDGVLAIFAFCSVFFSHSGWLEGYRTDAGGKYSECGWVWERGRFV